MAARKKLLTTTQAAKRLNLNVETIRRWIRDGRLDQGAVINLGTEENPRYRIRESALEAIENDGTGLD
jgi:excisionase family DNA binding protein